MSGAVFDVKKGEHRLTVTIQSDGRAMSFDEAREMLVCLAVHITNPSNLDTLAEGLLPDSVPPAKLRRVK